MNLNLYHLFLKKWFDLNIVEEVGIGNEKYVKKGILKNRKTHKEFVIKNFIPRFVDEENYAESFGFQWQRFRNLQHDSINGKNLTVNRFLENTKWKPEKLRGKVVLECGSGPGRFTEIFNDMECIVIAVDMSSAIDVNLENFGLHSNILYIQDNITNLYYLKGIADYVFCYGVLQHTPCPKKVFQKIVQYVKNGGKISVDIYEKMFQLSPYYGPKYFWRPITKRMNKRMLLKIIQWYIPKYINFDTAIRNLKIGKFRAGWCILGLIPIPCWNYISTGFSYEQRIQLTIQDIFDALSPRYDQPCSIKELKAWGETANNLKRIEVFRGSNGLVLNAVKK